MALRPGSPVLPAGESQTPQPRRSGKSQPAKIPGGGEHKPRRRTPAWEAQVRTETGRRRAPGVPRCLRPPLARARSLTKVHFVSGQEGVRQPERAGGGASLAVWSERPLAAACLANQAAGAWDSRDPRVRSSFASLRGPQLHDSRYSQARCVRVTKNP